MNITHVSGSIKKDNDQNNFCCTLTTESGAVITGIVPLEHKLNAEIQQEITVLFDTKISKLINNQPIQITQIDSLLTDLVIESAQSDSLEKRTIKRNIIAATSIALFKAFAQQENVQLYELLAFLMEENTVSLPCPQFLLLDNLTCGLDQILMAPLSAESLASAATISNSITELLTNSNSTDCEKLISDDIRTVLDTILETIGTAILFSENNQGLCALSLNINADKHYNAKTDTYALTKKTNLNTQELTCLYEELIHSYPIYALEDMLGTHDWEGWRTITEKLGHRTQIVGNNLLKHHPEQLSTIAEQNIATTLVIQPWQMGTVTGTLHFISLCKDLRLNVIIDGLNSPAHEAFAAELAVGSSAGQIKVNTKEIINRLLEIEKDLRANQ